MGFVRAKGPDGEFTIDEAAAKRMGVQILSSKPAVDRNGQPLAAKPATKLDGTPKASTDKPKEG